MKNQGLFFIDKDNKKVYNLKTVQLNGDDLMNKHWMPVWGCPISKTGKGVTEWMKDVTVRMRMLMTVDGTKLRFRLSNLFNPEKTVIERVTVSVSPEKRDQILSRLVNVTFGGDTRCEMQAFGDAVSDEMDFEFSAGEYLCVNMYFKDFTHLVTGHSNSGSFIKRWVCDGDLCDAEDLPTVNLVDCSAYPFIHSVEAYCDEDCYTIACFGDSITAQTWPDRFSLRLLSEGKTKVAAVRKGIGGSRVLGEYPCLNLRNYGPKGLDRFEREVCLPGVKKVFILHGINDIIHPDGSEFRPMTNLPTPEKLIEGLKFYVDTAHKHGIKAYVSKIMPFMGWHSYNEDREKLRREVNAWVDSGYADGVVPFEETLLDPDCPSRLKAEYDSGDHLHPSAAGAQKMADCIPNEII